MEIVEVTKETYKQRVGRLSDGSDTSIIEIHEWTAICKSKGRTYQHIFPHEEPAEAQIQKAFDDGLFEDITSDGDKIKLLEEENTALKEAIAEIILVTEQEKVDMKLAIAELASIVTGGNADA